MTDAARKSDDKGGKRPFADVGHHLRRCGAASAERTLDAGCSIL